MKKAIITGGSGLVGRSLAKYLRSNGIDVLCLGRKHLGPNDVDQLFGKDVSYIQLAMEDIAELSDKISNISWEVGDECIFYHFAWSGDKKLVDGSFEDQFRNATFSSLAVKEAKRIGCSKFINSGTLEETYAEWFIEHGLPYSSAQGNYAIAKLASRDMCAMTAYLDKLDYIHTRLSVPLSPDLSVGGYISKTLKKIANKESYDPPKNEQLYDITFTDDVAKAYYLIGMHGNNKADYFIGSGRPTTLSDYFQQFETATISLAIEEKDYSSHYSSVFFNTESLCADTGFIASTNRFDLFVVEESI